jgi:hypothetical protein
VPANARVDRDASRSSFRKRRGGARSCEPLDRIALVSLIHGEPGKARERYHQLWDARFCELDKVVEELKRKEKLDGSKKAK